MFLGFFAWYRGLATGPRAHVSQIQLLQPVMSICWAALLLGEALTWTTVAGALAVILCAAAAVRIRLKPTSQPHERTLPSTFPPTSPPSPAPSETSLHTPVPPISSP